MQNVKCKISVAGKEVQKICFLTANKNRGVFLPLPIIIINLTVTDFSLHGSEAPVLCFYGVTLILHSAFCILHSG